MLNLQTERQLARMSTLIVAAVCAALVACWQSDHAADRGGAASPPLHDGRIAH